jgi:hypothetical protein
MKMNNLSRLWILTLTLLPLGAPLQAKWGIDLSPSYWKADDADIRSNEGAWRSVWNSGSYIETGFSGDVKKFNWDLNLFMERPIRGSLWSWEASAGYARMAPVQFDLHSAFSNFGISGVYAQGLKHMAWSIPVTMGLRRSTANKKLSFMGGAGADWITLSSEYRSSFQCTPSMACPDVHDLSGRGENRKVSPHVILGVDYHATPNFSIGFGLKEIFNAEFDDVRVPLGGSGLDAGTEQQIIMNEMNLFYPPLSHQKGPSGYRPYKIDLGGLRVRLTSRYRFGSDPSELEAEPEVDEGPRRWRFFGGVEYWDKANAFKSVEDAWRESFEDYDIGTLSSRRSGGLGVRAGVFLQAPGRGLDWGASLGAIQGPEGKFSIYTEDLPPSPATWTETDNYKTKFVRALLHVRKRFQVSERVDVRLGGGIGVAHGRTENEYTCSSTGMGGCDSYDAVSEDFLNLTYEVGPGIAFTGEKVDVDFSILYASFPRLPQADNSLPAFKWNPIGVRLGVEF